MGERVVYCVAASYLRPFAACHGTVEVSRHKLVECVVATRRAELFREHVGRLRRDYGVQADQGGNLNA